MPRRKKTNLSSGNDLTINLPPENITVDTTHSTAQEFINLVKDGLTADQAAEILHIDLKSMVPDKLTAAKVTKLIRENYMPAQVRTAFVRAGLNKIALEALNSGDNKSAIDAFKEIAGDPEVGLKQDKSGGVVIDLGSIVEFLKDK